MVGVVLDPLLQAVNLSAARLPTTDMAVYLLNCLYQMQATLSLYGFMDDRLERLQVIQIHQTGVFLIRFS